MSAKRAEALKQFSYAVQRAIAALESSANAIDKANPGDPYASLMVREDVDTLREGLALLGSTHAAPASPAVMDVSLDQEQSTFLRTFMGDDQAEPPAPIRLQFGEGHSGLGLYVSLTEYPEEGSSLVWPAKDAAA
jgi:hypothetical protein